jgi:hypothetical protein
MVNSLKIMGNEGANVIIIYGKGFKLEGKTRIPRLWMGRLPQLD